MAGPSLQHQESHVYMRDFRGCRWALLQWFDFQHRLKIISGSKFKGSEAPLLSQDGDSTDMDSDSSTSSKHSSRKKPSGKTKSLLKSFIPKKFYRKQDQKQKILPLSPQLLRTISIHHLEPKKSKLSSTSTSDSSSVSGSSHGNVDIMANDSSSRNEDDSLLPRHLNVIQEKNSNRSSSALSKIHPDSMAPYTSNLNDATRNAESNQSRPQVTNKSIKQMITMESVLHKIPYGQKLPEHSKFSSNLNLFRSVSVTYDREGPHKVMNRSRSLSDSVGRYSQLLESLSRESTQKTTQPRSRLATDQSFKENTMANNTSQGKDPSSKLETVPSGTELTKDGPLQKQNSAVFLLQATDSILNASESVVDDTRLTKEESFGDLKGATCALSNGVESISFVQDVAKGVGSGSETSESYEECENLNLVATTKLKKKKENLNLVKEKEDFAAVQDEVGRHVNDYEIFQESSLSVLDSEFLDDPISSKIQNMEDLYNITGPNLKDISDDSETFGENANPALANYDILPSQLVQENDAELDNLEDLFENFGFNDGDFLEIIKVLLQEVHQENDKIPFGYDFTKFDYDFGGFDYDENMPLDQNILYALIHEALRENLNEYLANGTLVSSYTMIPKSNSLKNGLIKNLGKKISCYVNSEISFSGKNLIDGSLQNNGWLNYPREREHLVVELGDGIFDSILDELICEVC